MENEKDVLDRIVKYGSEKDMENIILHYQRIVFSFVYRIIGDFQFSEDITQEAFIRAFKYLKSFDTNKKFFPWLMKISRNVAINYINKNKKYIMFEDNIMELLESVQDNTNIIEKKDTVERILQNLTVEERELFFMRFNLDYSHKEISKLTMINESTVRSKISRGLKKIRQKVNKKND